MKSLEEIAEIHGPKFKAKNTVFLFDQSRMHEMWSALTTGVNLRDAGSHFYASEVEWAFSKDRAEWEYVGPFALDEAIAR